MDCNISAKTRGQNFIENYLCVPNCMLGMQIFHICQQAFIVRFPLKIQYHPAITTKMKKVLCMVSFAANFLCFFHISIKSRRIYFDCFKYYVSEQKFN